MAWQEKGSIWTAMGLIRPEDPMEKGSGRLFIEQRVIRAGTRSHNQWGSWILRDLGSQKQDERYKACLGHVLGRKPLWGPGTLERHEDWPGSQQRLGHPEFTALGT